MKPKPKHKIHEQPLIATMRLDLSLDMDHELVRQAGVIPWDRLGEDFGLLYCADNGRPAVPIRLMAGLHYLILIATSGYGKAAFEFANGKPLELLDEGHLLYLLKEHVGIDARIVMPDDWKDPVMESGA